MIMRRKQTQPAIHTNRLLPSTRDTVAFGLAVEERFLILCDRYLKTRGVELAIPPDLDRDMYGWRQMRVRHKQGDFRNTEDELKSTKRVAQWTVDVNNRLCEQPENKVPALET